VLVLLAARSLAAQAQQSATATPPNDSALWAGTRHLVLSKSQVHFNEMAPKAGTLLFEPIDNGFKVTVTATGPDDAEGSFSFTAKFDGKYYPVTGPMAEAGDAASIRRVGALELACTTKRVNGDVRFMATYALSKDGKAVTANITHSDGQLAAIYVYEK
jgi:hypothetical protein